MHLDSKKIKNALEIVHRLEKRLENPQGMDRYVAVANALKSVPLNEDEKGILLQALLCPIILNV